MPFQRLTLSMSYLKQNIFYRPMLYRTRELSIDYRGKQCKVHFDNQENIEEDLVCLTDTQRCQLKELNRILQCHSIVDIFIMTG